MVEISVALVFLGSLARIVLEVFGCDLKRTLSVFVANPLAPEEAHLSPSSAPVFAPML